VEVDHAEQHEELAREHLFPAVARLGDKLLDEVFQCLDVLLQRDVGKGKNLPLAELPEVHELGVELKLSLFFFEYVF
jgi:hypothetical protein